MILPLPGQLDLPSCDHEPSRLLLQRKADSPLKPGKAQLPMDIGLFGSDADQLDLIECLQEPVDDGL